MQRRTNYPILLNRVVQLGLPFIDFLIFSRNWLSPETATGRWDNKNLVNVRLGGGHKAKREYYLRESIMQRSHLVPIVRALFMTLLESSCCIKTILQYE